MSAQNIVAEHYESNFGFIFPFKTGQNLVAEHYERDFDLIMHPSPSGMRIAIDS